jgi:hypothetical protein
MHARTHHVSGAVTVSGGSWWRRIGWDSEAGRVDAPASPIISPRRQPGVVCAWTLTSVELPRGS